MFTILKRTTAIAALAALPLAAQAESQQALPDRAADAQVKQVQKPQSDAASSAAGAATTDGGDQGQSTPAKADGTAANGAANAGTTSPDVMDGKDVVEDVEPPAEERMNSQADANAQVNVLIATVGDSEIRRSDVLGAIRAMPPQLRQQPPEMLIPMALDQLVLRELILQEAREAGLESDPDVAAATAGNASDDARENAMVQVWLDRELEGAVTVAKVDETYAALQSELGEQTPSLEQIRAQIEQELRRQAFNEISGALQSDAEITVYGADGKPMTE